MSNQYFGGQTGQPGSNGQFPGQMPPPPEVNQFSGQMPPPPEVNQFPGQMPPPPDVHQFSGQMPPQLAQKRNKPMALLAMMVVATLVVIGGGAYAITRVLFPSGGYANPDDLAASIETAVETNSLMSLANALPPSEVSILKAAQQVDESDGQFNWSKMTSPEALGDYMNEIDDGITSIDSVVDQKSDSVAIITLRNWRGTMSVRPGIVDVIREHFVEAKGTNLSASEQDFFESMRETFMHDNFYADMLADFKDRGLRLVAVNEGGRWYVSPSMTMVEQTLGSDRRAAPRYDADFTDVEGASSPEEAVSGMVDALSNGASMSDKDFYRFLDLPERRIAAVYADADSSSLFAVWNLGMDEFRNNVQIDWGLSSTKVSGGAIVSVGTTSITAGDYSASFNGDTVTYSYPDFGYGYSSRSSSRKSQTVRFTEGLVNPERLGIFTVRDSTGWHVSAARTSGNLRMLKVTDGALDQAIDGGAGESLGYTYDTDISRDVMREIVSLRGDAGIVVIVWNFMKNSD